MSLCLVFAAPLSGCDEAGQARARASKSELVTLFDLKEALVTQQRVARSASFPEGFDPAAFLQPVMGQYAVKPQAAFSEGQPAAFVTTEMWVNYDEVWVQPGYFLVTAWNQTAPLSNLLRDEAGTRGGAIFDVGEDSAFYSPFWKFLFVEVPPGTPLNKYDSSLKILNGDLPLHDGPLGTYSLVPDDVIVSPELTHPLFGTPVRGVTLQPSKSWVNGKQVSYLFQGFANFRADEELVVEEAPLFMFAVRGPTGAPVRLDLPPVIGSVPLFSSRAAPTTSTATFGAFTRLYFVTLPATAAAFDMAAEPAASEALQAKAIDARAYQGRVALNGKPPLVMGMPMGTSCFAAPDFPASCVWLDSQKQIESRLGPQTLTKTEVTWASPIVDFGIPRGTP